MGRGASLRDARSRDPTGTNLIGCHLRRGLVLIGRTSRSFLRLFLAFGGHNFFGRFLFDVCLTTFIITFFFLELVYPHHRVVLIRATVRTLNGFYTSP